MKQEILLKIAEQGSKNHAHTEVQLKDPKVVQYVIENIEKSNMEHYAKNISILFLQVWKDML